MADALAGVGAHEGWTRGQVAGGSARAAPDRLSSTWASVCRFHPQAAQTAAATPRRLPQSTVGWPGGAWVGLRGQNSRPQKPPNFPGRGGACARRKGVGVQQLCPRVSCQWLRGLSLTKAPPSEHRKPPTASRSGRSSRLWLTGWTWPAAAGLGGEQGACRWARQPGFTAGKQSRDTNIRGLVRKRSVP